MEVEVTVGNDLVALCMLVVYASETLFRRQIVGKFRMCVHEKGWNFVPCFTAVGLTRQRVYCAVSYYNGAGSYIPLDGGAITLSDMTVLGLSQVIVGQHDRYAR